MNGTAFVLPHYGMTSLSAMGDILGFGFGCRSLQGMDAGYDSGRGLLLSREPWGRTRVTGRAGAHAERGSPYRHTRSEVIPCFLGMTGFWVWPGPLASRRALFDFLCKEFHGQAPGRPIFAASDRSGMPDPISRSGGCSWASGSRTGSRSSPASRPFAPAKPLVGRGYPTSGCSLGKQGNFEAASLIHAASAAVDAPQGGKSGA